MSVLAAAHHAQALVERARSLYAGEPPAVAAVDEPFGSAAHAVTEGVGKTTGLSGELIDRHTALGATATRELTRSGRTDVLLQAHLRTAAATVLSGAQQLNAIADRISAITEAAANANSPAAQRAVWVALRSEVAGVNSVVAAGRQDAITLAGRIRVLTYDRPGGQASASASPPQEASDAMSQLLHPCDQLYASMVADCRGLGAPRARAICYQGAAEAYANCLKA